MNMPYVPISYVIDGLVSGGLHILAGSPKVGKSWLALWLAVTVAKGESVWGNPVKRGTTLYLCLEDSTIRIQNRLLEIAEDAPDNVHFATEAQPIGRGLEEQLETFIDEHPDTVMMIIDTLQMIRGTTSDNTYANDYRDLSTLKKLADKHAIAILVIHHLRKEHDGDIFNRISGTTGLQGAVDGSFTLVEENRGSGKARLSCIGRDIEYRELELSRDEDNIWQLVRDSREQADMRQDELLLRLSGMLKVEFHFKGTATELADKLSEPGRPKISSKTITRKLKQNHEACAQLGISFSTRRSNGSRLVELFYQAAETNSRDDKAEKTIVLITLPLLTL